MVSSEDIDDFLVEPTSHATAEPSTASTSGSSSTAAYRRPSSTASSSPLDPSDPDFVGPTAAKQRKKNEVTGTLNRDKWLKALHLHANRGKWKDPQIFKFCTATVEAMEGADLSSFAISVETIRKTRIELDKVVAKTIKVC